MKNKILTVELNEAWNELEFLNEDKASLKDLPPELTFNYDELENYRDQLRQPGIYLYINKDNGHKYVGQAIDLYNRLLEHRQTANREDWENLEPIDAAIKHYGPEKFTINILKYVQNPALLDKWETRYIEDYKTYINRDDYNLTPGGNEINYFIQTPFWDSANKRFDKRSLNKVRAWISGSPLSFNDMLVDLAKPMTDQSKTSPITLNIGNTADSTGTLRKINDCRGVYKLNYYEKKIKGFTEPLNATNHTVGRNQHANRDFYIFDINETDLVPEKAIKGPLKDWREVSRFINNGKEIQDQQIKQLSRGKKRDGSDGGNYIYNGYKIKSFVRE